MIDLNLRRYLQRSNLNAPKRAPARTPARVAAAAGQSGFGLEQIEPRFLLAGDHPSLPGPWTPNPAADLVTLNTAAALTASVRGRPTGYTDQSAVFHAGAVPGTIAIGDSGDLFKFVMPAHGALTSDFVTVLADTITSGSTLDSFVEVYDSTGALIASGASNGTLSVGIGSGAAPDGWAGFEGTVGSTYYIRVKADPNIATGRTNTGSYTLRMDATTIDMTLETNAMEAPLGSSALGDAIGFREDEIIFRVQTRTVATATNSLAIFQAISLDQTALNPHLDVYGAASNVSSLRGFLRQDTDAGRQTDSFLTILNQPNVVSAVEVGNVYYLRVRADDLRATPAFPSVGQFTVQVHMEAAVVDIDPQTRLGQTADTIGGLGIPTPPNDPMGAFPPAGTGASVYTFTAQGNGVGIISVVAPPPPIGLPQPAVRFFDSNGQSLDFNKGNSFAQLVVPIVGGQTYFIVIEGFDNAANGLIQMLIEANHTFDANQPIDDHINTPGVNSLNWDLATPIRLSAPQQHNPNEDQSWFRQGAATGRLFKSGDTDLFQFTAPLSNLGAYPGDDGNQGTALYAGGNFKFADSFRHDGTAIERNNTAIWDAGKWWQTGAARQDNPTPPPDTIDGQINGPINAMTVWDPDGTGGLAPVLAVGGLFTRVNGTPANNIAFRVFNPTTGAYQWDTTYGYDNAGNPLSPPITTNGEVFALTTFNYLPNTTGDTGTTAELIIGGQFTDMTGIATMANPVNNIATLGVFTDGSGAGFGDNLLGGVSGGAGTIGVFALTTFDPPTPTAPAVTPPPALPDEPLGLYVGGHFANGGVAPAQVAGINNMARFGRPSGDVNAAVVWEKMGSVTTNNSGTAGVTGTVFSLATYDSPNQRPDAMGQPVDIPNMLYVGGSLTAGGSVAGANLFSYDVTRPSGASWASITGAAGAVRAMTTWAPTTDGVTTGGTVRLITGGDGNAGGTTGTIGLVALGGGTVAQLSAVDKPVRSLTAFEDGTGGTAAEPVYTPGYQVLYAGGDFTTIGGVTANHVARFVLGPTGFVWQALGQAPGTVPPPAPGGGVTGESDAPPVLTGVTTVRALTAFDDDIAGVWDRLERAASRVSLTLSAGLDGQFNGLIRVFDSNHALIYTNDTIAPPFPDPAGSLNPNDAPGTPAMLTIPGIWAGEVYYIEVSGQGGTGRYDLALLTDCAPPKVDESGQVSDEISDFSQPPGPGQWPAAPEIALDTNGHGKAFKDPLNANGPTSYWTRTFLPTPAGIQTIQSQDLPVIDDPDTAHLYQFRATNNGTVEIRIATKGITSAFREQQIDVLTGQIVADIGGAKNFDSPLHAAIRVFNNDFVQLGYADGNYAVAPTNAFAQIPVFNPTGPTNPTGTGENGFRFFGGDDPRLVIDVLRGNSYFIQVESAFKALFASNPDLVDWRHATGAYDLIISATPSIGGGVDDYFPGPDDNAIVDGSGGSAIPVDQFTGVGSISGAVQNVPIGPFANPNDADTFYFFSPAAGRNTVTVNPTDPTFAPRVRIIQFDPVLQQISIVAQAAGTPGQPASVNFPTAKGERFYVVVDGVGSQGRYIVNVAAQSAADDQTFSDTSNESNSLPGASTPGWANATGLQLNRFLGLFGTSVSGGPIAPTVGNIEFPGDQDIYKFTGESYEFAIVNVAKLSNTTLDPQVLVYEIGKDGAGLDVFLLIGRNDDIDQNNNNSRASFSITPGRDYYIVVKGVDPTIDSGRYTLSVNVNPTDDHPNDTDFPNGSIINLNFDSINFTSIGSIDGKIEIDSDTDLFRFTAPASGTANIVLARATGSTLALDLVVLNSNNTPIPGVTFTVIPASITSSNFNVIQGQQYYLLVRHKTPVPVGSTDTGEYAVTVHTDPVDDYLPTPGTDTPSNSDFTGAANIAISSLNGIGTLNAVLVPTGDSDLFKFTTLAAGPVTVRISTPSSTLNPKVLIFDSSHTLVFSGFGNGDSATISFNATGAGLQFFVLALATDGATGTAAVGNYTVTVSATLPGGGGGGPGPDDFPNAGEWADAANIGLDTRSGNGAISGVINPAGDTDLFKFTLLGDGFVDIQLNTPAGGLVDGQIKIFNSAHTLVFSDSAGIPGATAAIKFPGLAGEQYFVLVEPIGAATGSYTLRLATQPLTHYLFFPEGFAGSTIDEFVPIINPNAVTVNYEIFARYETGTNPLTPIFSGSIAPGQRGGVTISQHTNLGASLVRIGEPYALEIRSTGPLGASFSHYDFGASIGESFTDRTSTTWTFAEVNKDHNNYRDFLLFYNPGNVTANINVTLYYQNGTTTSFMTSVDSLRRGGINFDANANVTTGGKFGVKITSDQPIVANLTSYNLPRSGGDGVLGDADGGNTLGVVGNVSSGAGVTSSISILNTNTQAATVTVTADYGRTDIPKLVRVFVVNPGSQFNRLLSAVGLIPGQTAGLTYTSNLPVTFQATEYKLGDGDSTTTATSAARQYFFGDLFVNPALAGIKYIEQMGIYNPGAVAIDITATFLFADGSASQSTTFHVGASTFAFISIDQQPIILGRPGPTGFSIVLDSATPIVASLTHYDLFLNGGWSAIGSPIGLTNPLTTLVG